MALLSTLRHRVYSYISDRKSSNSSTSSRLEPRLDRRSMSPATRTKNWLTRNTPSTDFSNGTTPSVLGVQGSRITKPARHGRSTLSPLIEARYQERRYWDAPLFNKKAAYANDEDGEDMDDLDDDSELEDRLEDVISDDDDDLDDEDVDDEDPDDEDDLGNDTTLVAVENGADEVEDDPTLIAVEVAGNEANDSAGKVPSNISQDGQQEPDVEVDVEQERAEREAAFENAEREDWSDAEITLFHRLNMRGFEPLLHGTWRLDFNTIPEPLFTNSDDDVLIGSATGHNFRAIRAFASLMNLGTRVRDRLNTSQAPETTLQRDIDSYIRWSHRDAALNRQNHIPVLAVATATAGQDTQDAIDSVTARLQHLTGLYREKWRVHPSVEGGDENDQGNKGKEKEKEKSQEKGKGKEKKQSRQKGKRKQKKKTNPDFEHDLPTLYGLVIVHTVVAIVTLDANHPDNPVRSIAQFDFSDEDHDVWNVFAIAIVVVLVRNYLTSIRELDLEVAEPQNQSDPDA